MTIGNSIRGKSRPRWPAIVRIKESMVDELNDESPEEGEQQPQARIKESIVDELNDENPEEGKQQPLREGEDFYFENGLMVFTAEFLKRRGYCCESGCRHCPYGYVRDIRLGKDS